MFLIKYFLYFTKFIQLDRKQAVFCLKFLEILFSEKTDTLVYHQFHFFWLFDVDTTKNAFHAGMELQLYWNDPRLIWNSSQYFDESYEIPISNIWMPKIDLLSNSRRIKVIPEIAKTPFLEGYFCGKFGA